GSGAGAQHFFQGESAPLLHDAGELVAVERPLVAAAVKRGFAGDGLGLGLDPRLAVPAVAWKSARHEHDRELAVSLGDDLGGQLVLAAAFTLVFALDKEVTSRLVGFREGWQRFLFLLFLKRFAIPGHVKQGAN